MFAAASAPRSSSDRAPAARSLQPLHVDPERSFGLGRPAAAPKLGHLSHAHIELIFDTHILAGYLPDRPFRAPLLCVDGRADQLHWVHTTEGRVRLSPHDRAYLFDR